VCGRRAGRLQGWRSGCACGARRGRAAAQPRGAAGRGRGGRGGRAVRSDGVRGGARGALDAHVLAGGRGGADSDAAGGCARAAAPRGPLCGCGRGRAARHAGAVRRRTSLHARCLLCRYIQGRQSTHNTTRFRGLLAAGGRGNGRVARAGPGPRRRARRGEADLPRPGQGVRARTPAVQPRARGCAYAASLALVCSLQRV